MKMPKISSKPKENNFNEIFGRPDDEISQKSTYVFCAVDELSNTMVPKM